ncbi:hypothetical protein IE983_03390 [Enterobacter hormaechei]|uniref:Uncharacterized protein n=1 Tax=Enterobacter hormaechei TaxID=158836 RepID=A0A927DJX2_9ENTR|nr:hypothetical protein [Enterobacter hormaechei]
MQKNPLTIEIDTVDALPAIEQQFFETSQQGKNSTATKIAEPTPASVLRGVL